MKHPRLRRSPVTNSVIVACIGASLAAAPAFAGDGAAIATQGTKAGAPACASCHGAEGQGSVENGFPRLAGLKGAYLVEQLRSFTDGSRQSDTMTDIAEALSADDRQPVASYYAGLSVADATDIPPSDSKLVSRGKELASIGDWAHGVPSCGQCHGPAGQGVGDSFPRIAGQPITYIENQFAAWKAGKRKNDPLHLMAGIARKLSNDDVKAVAAYYTSLDTRQEGGAHE